jgi:hypothetical protein
MFAFYFDLGWSTGTGALPHYPSSACNASCGTEQCLKDTTTCIPSYNFDEYEKGKACDPATCAGKGCIAAGACRTCDESPYCHLCPDIECLRCTGYSEATCTACTASRAKLGSGDDANTCKCDEAKLYARDSISAICKLPCRTECGKSCTIGGIPTFDDCTACKTGINTAPSGASYAYCVPKCPTGYSGETCVKTSGIDKLYKFDFGVVALGDDGNNAYTSSGDLKIDGS